MIQAIKKLLKNDSVLSLAGNLTTAGLGFFNFFLLARILSKEQFGEWVFYLTLVGLFEMIRAGFLRTPLIRNIFESEKEVIGSTWLLALCYSFLVILISLVLLFVFPSAVEKADLTLFVYWFGALSLANLPTNVTFWIQQAKSRFDLILINRLIQLAPYTFMLAYVFFSEYAISIHEIALIHLSTNALGGFIAVIFGWSGIKNLSKFNTLWINKIYQFGRYTVGSVIGTNLLKSSDTFIIKYFLGSASLAVYSIANKVIEILEIPIRSFVATVLPKMAKSHANKAGSNVIADLYTKNVGLLSVALIPVLIGIFIFAEFVVVLIGGAEYQDAALILRIFVVYGFFLTVDRFTGITLDAINQPQHNFIKMIAMVTANVVLDLIAVYTLGTLWSISVVTIITILTGVIVGNSFLKKKIDIQYGKILGEGTHFWKSLILKQIKKS